MIRRMKQMTDVEIYHYAKHVHKCLDQVDRGIIFELAERLRRANDKLSTKDRI